jgi:hypothetical protein
MGTRDARVRKFSAAGELIKSRAEPENTQERSSKNKPGFFHTPHLIGVHGDKVWILAQLRLRTRKRQTHDHPAWRQRADAGVEP